MTLRAKGLIEREYPDTYRMAAVPRSNEQHDNEKWSVPGRHDYRLVLATWSKVSDLPRQLLDELAVTMGFGSGRGAGPSAGQVTIK
jgi:hypothetical protein